MWKPASTSKGFKGHADSAPHVVRGQAAEKRWCHFATLERSVRSTEKKSCKTTFKSLVGVDVLITRAREITDKVQKTSLRPARRKHKLQLLGECICAKTPPGNLQTPSNDLEKLVQAPKASHRRTLASSLLANLLLK